MTRDSANSFTTIISGGSGGGSLSKFYLHDAASGNTGTLPTGDVPAVTGAPNYTAAGAATQRSMNGTIGSLQIAAASADGAVAGGQEGFYRMFLSAPVQGQTIASQNVTLRCGIQQSNTDSNLQLNIAGLFLWRPSTGLLVASGTLLALSNSGGIVANTIEQDFSWTALSTAVTPSTGDIIALEVYLRPVHGAAVSYTDTFYYDGTTEGSAASNAAYLLFTNPILMV